MKRMKRNREYPYRKRQILSYNQISLDILRYLYRERCIDRDVSPEAYIYWYSFGFSTFQMIQALCPQRRKCINNSLSFSIFRIIKTLWRNIPSYLPRYSYIERRTKEERYLYRRRDILTEGDISLTIPQIFLGMLRYSYIERWYS